jgi:hypothetical protein
MTLTHEDAKSIIDAEERNKVSLRALSLPRL